MIYSYNRVSTASQNLDRQLEAFQEWLKKENKENEKVLIFADKESGKDFERENYQKMVSLLKENDLVVIKSIDRLGRNYDMIIEEWQRITKKLNCDIVVLDMPLLDTRTDNRNLVGKFISDIVLQVLSFVAENERTNIKQRQAEGIKIAKAKGVKFGRPKSPKMEEEKVKAILEDYQNGMSIKDILEKYSIVRKTLYELIKENGAEPRRGYFTKGNKKEDEE